jgi:hypothetical protein
MLGKEDINGTIKVGSTMSQNRFQVISKSKETHRQNIQRNIEHRLEVAKAKGDERLVGQLEAEIRYFS